MEREYQRKRAAYEKSIAKPTNRSRSRRARKGNAVCEHGPSCFVLAVQSMPQHCSMPGCLRKEIQANHIIPLAKGGLDCRDNFQPLCRLHNAIKGGRRHH